MIKIHSFSDRTHFLFPTPFTPLSVYFCFLYRTHEIQALQIPGVLRPGGSQINPRRSDIGMPQHISQLDDVPAHPVKSPGEQMAQIMWKNLGTQNPRLRTESLHFRPDLLS